MQQLLHVFNPEDGVLAEWNSSKENLAFILLEVETICMENTHLVPAIDAIVFMAHLFRNEQILLSLTTMRQASPQNHSLCWGEMEELRVQEWLPVQACDLLKSLKVVLLVCSMLVHNEHLFAEPGQDEAKVELTNHIHASKIALLEDALELR